jgi:hypothetical protein
VDFYPKLSFKEKVTQTHSQESSRKKTRDGAAVAVPQMRLNGWLGLVAEDYARNGVAEQNKYDDARGGYQFVLPQVWKRVVAVADCQITDAEVADGASQRDRGCKTPQRDFEYTRSKHKKLKWGWWWQKRGDEHSDESILFDPVPNGRGTVACLAMKECFPSLSRDEIEKHAAEDRAGCSHQRIERHARGMLDGEFDQQKVVNHGKGEHGRVEKRNEKESRCAEASCKGDDFLFPGCELEGQEGLREK